MDVIKSARELGKAIQADERYKDFNAAKIANDNDENLQKLIGDFNITRSNLQMEMSKPDDQKDKEKMESLNTKMQEQYEDVMKNVNMANFVIMKNAMDNLLQEVNTIISLCCEGEDPDTCEAHSCSGSCSTCGGCH